MPRDRRPGAVYFGEGVRDQASAAPMRPAGADDHGSDAAHARVVIECQAVG
jgi:hypothetical protein